MGRRHILKRVTFTSNYSKETILLRSSAMLRLPLPIVQCMATLFPIYRAKTAYKHHGFFEHQHRTDRLRTMKGNSQNETKRVLLD